MFMQISYICNLFALCLFLHLRLFFFFPKYLSNAVLTPPRCPSWVGAPHLPSFPCEHWLPRELHLWRPGKLWPLEHNL